MYFSRDDNLEPQIQEALGGKYQPERYIYRLVRATEVPFMLLYLATKQATEVGQFQANGVAHSQLSILQIPRPCSLRSSHSGHHKTSSWARRAPNP